MRGKSYRLEKNRMGAHFLKDLLIEFNSGARMNE